MDMGKTAVIRFTPQHDGKFAFKSPRRESSRFSWREQKMDLRMIHGRTRLPSKNFLDP